MKTTLALLALLLCLVVVGTRPSNVADNQVADDGLNVAVQGTEQAQVDTAKVVAVLEERFAKARTASQTPSPLQEYKAKKTTAGLVFVLPDFVTNPQTIPENETPEEADRRTQAHMAKMAEAFSPEKVEAMEKAMDAVLQAQTAYTAKTGRTAEELFQEEFLAETGLTLADYVSPTNDLASLVPRDVKAIEEHDILIASGGTNSVTASRP